MLLPTCMNKQAVCGIPGGHRNARYAMFAQTSCLVYPQNSTSPIVTGLPLDSTRASGVRLCMDVITYRNTLWYSTV